MQEQPTMEMSFDWLRFADPYLSSEDERADALRKVIRSVPVLMDILTAIKQLALPDCWLVSGAIYQTTWNVITGRPHDHGLKDYDVVYFDGADLSYEAEDLVIRKVERALPHLASKIETRNQARVHLWYEKRFGRTYQPLDCTLSSLVTYAAKTHAIAARFGAEDAIELHAPFGLTNLFAMRLAPNTVTDNKQTYDEKGARMKALWPELIVEPWLEA